ncbi:ABC transporter permease [Sinomonas sp. JGH33]|uniref:ABC transporter permease n=1 Tax=Sinomonas terricola TaxID=3110330 RepID=A0ABU5T222_9MICC|nr:ABC transporter permease [Sinomonas sp. JGH33]MEA5453699.1 ABC transporter permease [Sinomonas sp. JGH33]
MKTLHVFWKDLLILSKDRGTYINLFVLPLMFSIVLTIALGGVFGGGKSDSPVTIPVAASGTQAEAVAQTITSIPGITWRATNADDAKAAVDQGKSIGAVLVSRDGKGIDFYEDPSQLTNAQLLYGQISAALHASHAASQAARLGQAVKSSGNPQAEALAESVANEQGVSLTTSRAGNRDSSAQPTAAEQYIPGFTVAFLFFIASTIAQYLFMERERGTLRRLLTSPVSRSSILAGKLLPTILIGFVQVVVIFAVGRLAFGMTLGSPAALFLVTCAAVAAANGFGLMITSLSKTQAQATGLATLLVFTLATVAGCYVPLSLMPGFMQSIALATPQGWAMQAYQSIIMKGADSLEILPSVGVLVAFSLAFFGIGLVRFRFEER